MLFPTEIKYIYILQYKKTARCQIDYILLSDHLINSLSKINVITASVPDHKAVVVDLKLNPKKRDKGYWNLDCNFLSEDKYIQYLKKYLRDTVNEYENCPKYLVLDL